MRLSTISPQEHKRQSSPRRNNDVLSPGAATTVLANKFTMKDMTRADYAEISEINVSMTGYACKTSDVESIDEAWEYIKSKAEM